MKIVQLDIQGFRSLKNVSWRPGDLNVIIGPNGSGKSNLLRMLEMISAAAQGRLSRFVQAEGGMRAILWDGTGNEITFSIEVSGVSPLALHTNTIYEVDISSLDLRFDYYIEREQLQDTNEGNEYLVVVSRVLLAHGYAGCHLRVVVVQEQPQAVLVHDL